MIEFILPFAMNPMVVVCCCDEGGGVAVGSLLGWAVVLAVSVAFGSWDDDIISCLGNVALDCCEVIGNVELSG